jgi:hypothetical protein
MITKEEFYAERVRPKAYWYWKIREHNRRKRNWFMAMEARRKAGKYGPVSDEELRPLAEEISRKMAPADALTDWTDAEWYEAQILLANMGKDEIQTVGGSIPFIGERVGYLVRHNPWTN